MKCFLQNSSEGIQHIYSRKFSIDKIIHKTPLLIWCDDAFKVFYVFKSYHRGGFLI